MQTPFRKAGLTGGICVAVAMLALAGCAEKAKDSTQSLVNVNGSEITIHQLNAEVKTSPNLPMSTLLDGLVNRQLLVDAAKKSKLDEDPAVLAELQKSRDTVLAQAYIARHGGRGTAPTDEEVEQFYKEAPDMFAQRRQYQFGEAVIDAKDMNPKIEAFMSGKKHLDDLTGFLDSENVHYRRETLSRTSAELPPVMAASLRTMELNTVFVVKENAQTILMTLQDAKPAPVSQSAAAPQIRQMLAARKYTEQVNAQIKPLKDAAKIEYLARGEAIMKSAPVANQQAAKDQKVADDGHIDRGIAGMK